MSLFTRLGSCSVKRRTNRVFPKPPRCDETTRTESLQKISMLAAQFLITRSPLFRTIPLGPYNRVSLFEILHFRNGDFSQFEQNTSTNFASFTCIARKTFFLEIFQGYLRNGGFPVLISGNISENLLFWV